MVPAKKTNGVAVLAGRGMVTRTWSARGYQRIEKKHWKAKRGNYNPSAKDPFGRQKQLIQKEVLGRGVIYRKRTTGGIRCEIKKTSAREKIAKSLGEFLRMYIKKGGGSKGAAKLVRERNGIEEGIWTASPQKPKKKKKKKKKTQTKEKKKKKEEKKKKKKKKKKKRQKKNKK